MNTATCLGLIANSAHAFQSTQRPRQDAGSVALDKRQSGSNYPAYTIDMPVSAPYAASDLVLTGRATDRSLSEQFPIRTSRELYLQAKVLLRQLVLRAWRSGLSVHWRRDQWRESLLES